VSKGGIELVRLTDYEQKMLNGEMGPYKQLALKHIVDYANALGAEELCEVTKATLFFGAHHYLDVVGSDCYNEIFSKMYMCSDEVMSVQPFDSNCFCQTCAGPTDDFIYEPLNFTKEYHEKNQEYLEITKNAGACIAGSCTPYFTGWIPVKGEHYVTTESSNVLMSNSVFGACGNSDGLEAAVWSAVCGRTPLWGKHLPENRYGTHIFWIECTSETRMDWDLIGFTLGRKLPPHAIPIIAGNFKRPDIIKLKKLFSAMATASGAEMCHIVGVTPEAQTLEMALGGKEPIAEIKITQADRDESYRMLCSDGSGEVDFVSLGCPHYNLQEIKEVCDYIKGKKVKDGVRFLVWTDLSTKGMADFNHYTDIITDAGGYLVTSGCPLNAGVECHGKYKGLVFAAAKMTHYISSESEAKVYYATPQQAIDAAIKGYWEG